MIATTHVIIGGTIGVITNNPVLGFAAGFASHIICDGIPHLDAPFKVDFKNGKYDEPIWTRKLIAFAVSDSVFAFLLALFIWNRNFDLYFFAPYAWGALGAYIPDFIDNVPLWSDRIRRLPGLKQFHKLHLDVHDFWRFKFPMPEHWALGALTQIVFIIPCLWILLH